MASVKKVVFIIVAIGATGAAVLLGVLLQKAHAQSLDEPTEQQLRLISERCDLVKTRLRSAEKTDAAARIKRGRAYDQELIPYISAFNSRIAINKVDAPELISIAAELQQQAGPRFGELYTKYADDLEEAIRSDCKDRPEVTYGWIQRARADRAAVAEQVKLIDRLTGRYIDELEKLELRFTPAINKPSEGS